MIIRDNGELVTEEDKSDSDEIPKLKDASDVEWVEYHVEGESLVERHAL